METVEYRDQDPQSGGISRNELLQPIKGFRISPLQRSLWLRQQDSQAYRAQCAILIEIEV
jgi:hypothetical protein